MRIFKRLLFLLLFLTGCSTTYMGKNLFGADEFVLDSYKIREGKFSILEMEGAVCEELDESLLEEYADSIYEDDILQVTLYIPERSDLMQAVSAISDRVGYRIINGNLTLPDLPPIQIAGLTLEEASLKIQERYREQIEDTSVFLSYKTRIAKKVELAGLVFVSNVPVDGKVRLFDILSQAKIPTDANLFKSYMIREGNFVPVDMHRLLKEGDMTQNVVMHGGDKIYIAESSAATIMVMGEVGREQTLPLPSGRMPLRQALAQAGGIPFTGDKSYIQIIRGNIAKPKIYTLNWEHVIHLPNNSLLLMPGDIVYVAAKPITEWNRFISQLLPSFSGFDLISGKIQVLLP